MVLNDIALQHSGLLATFLKSSGEAKGGSIGGGSGARGKKWATP